jgi:hypothetical protein
VLGGAVPALEGFAGLAGLVGEWDFIVECGVVVRGSNPAKALMVPGRQTATTPFTRTANTVSRR